jgi:hypothetical protein
MTDENTPKPTETSQLPPEERGINVAESVEAVSAAILAAKAIKDWKGPPTPPSSSSAEAPEPGSSQQQG